MTVQPSTRRQPVASRRFVAKYSRNAGLERDRTAIGARGDEVMRRARLLVRLRVRAVLVRRDVQAATQRGTLRTSAYERGAGISNNLYSAECMLPLR
jgi:hypothetical protein